VVLGLCAPAADTTDPETLIDAVLGRGARQVPNEFWVDEGTCTLSDRGREMCRLLEQATQRFISKLNIRGFPDEFEEWLAKWPHPEHRKQEIRYARDVAYVSRRQSDFKVINIHGKREAYTAFKILRSINARVDPYKALSGRWFKWLEKFVFELKQFAKKVPYRKLAQKVTRLTNQWPYVYVTDYSRFEASITETIMRLVETQVYRAAGIPEEYIEPLLGVQILVNKKHKIRIRTKAYRQSGDMVTSMGNGITNYVLCDTVCTEHGIEWDGLFEGDDGIIGTNKPISSEWFSDYGFVIKLEAEVEPGRLGFCSRYFSPNGTYFMSPFRIVKHGWSFTCPTNAGRNLRSEIWKAKNLSIACEFPRSPIAWAFAIKYAGEGRILYDWWLYTKLLGMGVQVKLKKNWMYLEGVPEILEPTAVDRAEYFSIFGVSPASQIDIERQIMRGNNLISNQNLVDVCLAEYPELGVNWEYFVVPGHVDVRTLTD
jgi:hypothetical protein